MKKVNLRRQKAARSVIQSLFDTAGNVLAIHYSCESFYDRPNGASPRITSIAIRRLDSAQTASFSIHQVAERHGHNINSIDATYDTFERQMLDEYFAFIERHSGHHWLHWNMRDINYGFAAIEHRHRVLGGNPIMIADDHKVDLARLLTDLYGVGYIGHPRLERLVEKNGITRMAFMTGAEEAAAFEARNYVSLHQSTLRKVDIITNIAGRVHDRTLKTNATWWELHGSSVRGVTDAIAIHPAYVAFAIVAGGASVGGLWLALR
jgi:hypothetical protein